MVIRILATVQAKVQSIVLFFCPSFTLFPQHHRHTHTYQEEILFHCLLCFLFLPPTSPSTSLPLVLYRCAAGDADACGEEDLSVPADGGHAVGHPVLPDTAVQTPLRTHQERQVSRPPKSRVRTNTPRRKMHHVLFQSCLFTYPEKVKSVFNRSV